MLSILIPIYNYDAREFVKELHSQCLQSEISFEILCFDDCSKPDFIEVNREIINYSNVSLKELSQNVGRSKIRNWLARDAQYEYLLFMDCDSFPSSPKFIQNYVDFLHPNQLLYGGRSYSQEKPKDATKILRWKYGLKRECFTSAERSAAPYKSFMTNNFLIPKAIFSAIEFNETIQGYGHEDTLFGMELRRWKIPIEHIDNPLIHLGLESSDDFLAKTLEGINNLYHLKKRKLLKEDVKLLRFYAKLSNLQLQKTFFRFFRKMEPIFLKDLHSSNPNLFYFDLWKLGKLLELDYKN